jgi:polar amino acid transport system substrate-binding protein
MMTNKKPTLINRRHLLAFGAVAIAAPSVWTRKAYAVTPAEIKARGKVLIGIQGDNPPWGFVDSSGKQDGLDADISALFAKELGVPAEFTQLAVANRIPALTSGRVDILFATMAMLPERAKAVQFSKPYGANIITFIAPKDMEIKSPADMGKYVIGVARGSVQDTDVT